VNFVVKMLLFSELLFCSIKQPAKLLNFTVYHNIIKKNFLTPSVFQENGVTL